MVFSGLLTDEAWVSKRPLSLKSVTHILQWWNLVQLCLTWSRSTKCMNCVTSYLSSADIRVFLTGNQRILPYQEIQTKFAFCNIISKSFNFFWIFKDCFNIHGYNFDDVSKNGYSGPSYIYTYGHEISTFQTRENVSGFQPSDCSCTPLICSYKFLGETVQYYNLVFNEQTGISTVL